MTRYTMKRESQRENMHTMKQNGSGGGKGGGGEECCTYLSATRGNDFIREEPRTVAKLA